PDVVAAEFAENAALRRAVEPNEITSTVMFLCSDDASAITGQEIRVCAGAAMGRTVRGTGCPRF
ncbi:MAG: SDR family oxidoreductase, partial [Deltaproteobacteria bacterium]|nr:SDR family oxidoreductase [Deltaproteobacteria bacterium]